MRPQPMSQDDRFPDIQGYCMTHLLHDGERTRVYRGIRLSDSSPVVLKLLRAADFPSMQDLLRLRNHYIIASKLNLPGIVQPLCFLPDGNSFVLVLPDEGAIPLSDYVVAHSLDLAEVLEIALQLADILHDLYQNQVIHKDIKPANILIHPETKQVKLTGFSFASLLPKETQEIQNSNVLEGTLAYLSPEQTGRMNRGIDYRTDFYALGITLFELLTGQLPFQSSDPTELVYSHIAKQSPALQECKIQNTKCKIPQVVADVVAKLMAKNAEDRYQSALGLKHDLKSCSIQLQETGTIEIFEIGTRDLCDRFLIPEKLYGREAEVQVLLNAFDQVAQGHAELMLVAGFSGIGKTAVVNEVHKPIVRQRGYFIKGKFDQFNRNIPFSAFVQALRDLMGQLLSESNARLTQWQSAILAAVADNGQVLIDLIPELESVIGKQPPVPELSGTAAQNRFNWLFQKFIQVFTTPEHPLVMFLDDLQWADTASLQLIKVLIEDKRYLLLLGAYRDNEVFPAHPFQLAIADLKQTGKAIHTLTLTPLSIQDANQWIAETLHCSTERSRPLTEFVVRKTQGNPFFITQFLKTLHQDGQITFNHDQGYWECDLAQVNTLSLTEDVVELMTQQLQKLPETTQQILKLAACMGNQFDLETLAIVSEQSEASAAAALWHALQEELILPQSKVYKFYLSQQEVDTNPNNFETMIYRFLHDRVQQAAYSLIPDAQKQLMHYKIGQRLLNNSSESEREKRLFEIVNQSNMAIDLIEKPDDRAILAALNLMAGRKANSSTAYRAAAQYFAIGRNLLANHCWQHQYDLTLALSVEAAEAAYLNADLDEMESLMEEVLHQSRTALDAVRVYKAKINAYTSQGQLLKAIRTGATALQQFGIDLPESPDLTDVDRARQKAQALLGGQSPAALLEMPEMTDLRILAVLQILEALSVPAYLAKPNLNLLIIMIQIELSIIYGNASGSALAYASYGLFLCAVAGDIEQGYEFGQLALSLLEKLKEKRLSARVLFVTAIFIFHWKVHLRECSKLLQHAYAIGWESGSFMDLGYAAMGYSCNAFWLDDELPKLEQEIAAYSKVLMQINQQTQYNYNELYHQAVLNILGRTKSPFFLLGEAEKEQVLLNQYQQANDSTGLWHFYFIKVMLCFLFQKFELATEYIEQAAYYVNGGKGMFNVPAFRFYASLIWLADWPKQLKSEQEQRLQKVVANQNQMQGWAAHAPMNHSHKFHLVEAERHRVLGNKTAAIELYDQAIVEAQKNGFIQDEALANELAAKFYLDWGKERVARDYMQEAHDCYTRWGAKAKTDDLGQRYPQLLSSVFEPVPPSISPQGSIVLSQISSGLSQSLDLDTIIKASQTLSSEIQLDKLLQTLIQLVITNAGADKAALFLNADGVLELAIEYFDNAVKSLVTQATDDWQNVPLALIHYVEHALETVITDYKTHPSTISDPYCLRYQPQSLLCTPILNQGKLVAILYLENAITAAAFTDERVELLKVFCAQAAISLENARLYQKSQSYAQLLEDSLGQLQESETRFHHLAANIPGVIYQIRVLADETVSIPYVSSGCHELYEVAAEEIMDGSYSFQDFEHIEDRAIVNQAIAEASQTLTPFNLEFRVVTRSGVMKWIQSASQPRKCPDGSILWDGLMIDISDRKTAEVQLQYQAQQLERANQQLAEYSQTLEQKVAARTQELSQALTNLQATQTELIQVEKMAALGQLTASVAHEINTPLGVIRSATSNIAAALSTSLQQIPVLLQSFSPQQQTDFLALVNDALTQQTSLSTHEERQLRRQLQQELIVQRIAQADKIATQLVLLRLGPHLQAYKSILQAPNCVEILQTAYNLVLQQQSVSNIQQEVDRAAKIVFALKTYSHQDNRGQQVLAKITDGIEVVLTLYQNRFRQGIQVVRRYDPVPEILCDPDVLTQVWVNLVDNAIYAMGQQGILEVAVTRQDEHIVVTMQDSGCGIPPEIQARIFEPFFTTKPRGEGSGLGLDIVVQILQKQGGTIQLDSQPGNTLVTVKLPISSIEFKKSPHSEIDHE